jgi:hypothetical protein
MHRELSHRADVRRRFLSRNMAALLIVAVMLCVFAYSAWINVSH